MATLIESLNTTLDTVKVTTSTVASISGTNITNVQRVYGGTFNTLIDTLKIGLLTLQGYFNGTTAITPVIDKTAVTQITSSSTGVTIDKPAGVITTVALTTAHDATEVFVVTNSYVVATSVISLTAQYASGKTGIPVAMLEGTPGTGSFSIKIANAGTTAALNDVVKIHFLVS